MLHTQFQSIDIDEKLLRNVHISNICSTLTSAVFSIRKVKKLVQHSAAVITYSSLFESVMRYALSISCSVAYSFRRHLYHPKKTIRSTENSCIPLFKTLYKDQDSKVNNYSRIYKTTTLEIKVTCYYAILDYIKWITILILNYNLSMQAP